MVGDDDDDDDDDSSNERRLRRDDGDFLSRSSIFCHSERALCSERSSHLEGALQGFDAVEMVSVMGKHLVFLSDEGQESG